MGNDESKLVDEGGGEFDPTKNYDKRTSRKHHRKDFESCIEAWKEQIKQSSKPDGSKGKKNGPAPINTGAGKPSDQGKGARPGGRGRGESGQIEDNKVKSPPRKRRSPRRSEMSPTASSEFEALGMAADLPPSTPEPDGKASPNSSARKRAHQLVNLKKKNRGRNSSVDSQPPPPPLFPPPLSSPGSVEQAAGEEEGQICAWFQNLCIIDPTRAEALLNQLEKIHTLVKTEGETCTPAKSGKALKTQEGGSTTPTRSPTWKYERGRNAASRHSPGHARPGARSESEVKDDVPMDRRVTVFVRKRPMFAHERTEDFDVVDASGIKGRNSIVVFDTRMQADMRRMKMTPNVYKFDKVFDESASNDIVFKATTLKLVDHALAGNLASGFMFGQTGSGKTFTMTAMIKGAGREIFRRMERSDQKWSVTISMFELYGTKCRDLLDASIAKPSHQESLEEESTLLSSQDENGTKNQDGTDELLRLLEDKDGSLQIDGLTEKDCHSEAMFAAEFKRGQDARATCETGVHDRSSRSHAFYRIRVQNGNHTQGELLLVDLAGSERNKDSFAHSARLQKECAEINSSLMALKNCFRAQASKQAFVPFRGSMLTRILRQSLVDPNAKTVIIATVSPSSGDTEHTLSTLGNVSMMLSDSNASLRHQKLETQEVKSLKSIAAEKAYEEAKQADPRRWSAAKVQSWWAEHAPATIEPPSNVSGAMLSNWPKQRFVRYCVDAQKARAGRSTRSSLSPTPSPVPSPRPSPRLSMDSAPSPRRTESSSSRPGSRNASRSPAAAIKGPQRKGEELYEAFRAEIAKLGKMKKEKVRMKTGLRAGG